VVGEPDQVIVGGDGSGGEADGAEVQVPVADADNGGFWDVVQLGAGADERSVDGRVRVLGVEAYDEVCETADVAARPVEDESAAEAGDGHQLSRDPGRHMVAESNGRFSGIHPKDLLLGFRSRRDDPVLSILGGVTPSRHRSGG
jgi:hypothetical protein